MFNNQYSTTTITPMLPIFEARVVQQVVRPFGISMKPCRIASKERIKSEDLGD